MDKLEMHTPDLTQRNIDAIAELFPAVVTETFDSDGRPIRAIDFDSLRQELSGHIVEGPQERYQLDWPGKRAAAFAANAPIAKTLRPVREESVDFDTTKNLFIEGDNLDALKLLQESYLGKVKLIYIDPPYNTGNDFIYDDDFAESGAEYLARSGQKSETGDRLVANPESNGRFHSDWLSMMYPRLKLVRNLLQDDGVVFVSCDEVEQPRLRQILDETFGGSNYVADFVWAAGRKNDSRFVSISHEYILCYVRNKSALLNAGVKWRQRKKGLEKIYAKYERLAREFGEDYDSISHEMKQWFKSLPDDDDAKSHRHYSHADARGLYFPDNISWPGGGGPKYEVLHPITGRPVKIPSRGWMTSDPSKMKAWIDDDRVHFGPNESSVPCIKSYLKDREYQTPYSVFYQDGRAASKRLRSLLGGDFFDFPKDESVLQELIEMTTNSDDLILDLFAGAGPVAHAVIMQNSIDGGDRRCISVQIAEEFNTLTRTGRNANLAGFPNVAALSRERIRRAGIEVKENAGFKGERLDIGLRVLNIDSTNIADTYTTPGDLLQHALSDAVGSVKPDRTDEDLLFQVMLDWGLDLAESVTVDEVAARRVLSVAENALIACFADEVTDEIVRAMADRRPLRAVFLDAGFATDSARINAEQIFREVSPETEVRTI